VEYGEIVEQIGRGVDVAGIIAIVGGIMIATTLFAQ
jgi:hypothetical protein